MSSRSGARVANAKTSASSSQPPRTKKRSAPAVIDLTQDESNGASPAASKRKRMTKTTTPKKSRDDGSNNEEKRLRRWRSHAPSTYVERHHRALSQRMFVLDRERARTADGPREKLAIAGTTGNLYEVTIARLPSCTCPDNANGNMCKHIIYALVRVLKAPAQLQYQLALLTSELEAMFAAAPLLSEVAHETAEHDTEAEDSSNRKPISGECPICFCDMSDDDPADVVWCRASCGNNVHKLCFQQWARSSGTSGVRRVRCVYCRAEWQPEGLNAERLGNTETEWKGDKSDFATLKANATVGDDGYHNVADQLGLDPIRDVSTYHRPWSWGRRW